MALELDLRSVAHAHCTQSRKRRISQLQIVSGLLKTEELGVAGGVFSGLRPSAMKKNQSTCLLNIDLGLCTSCIIGPELKITSPAPASYL